MNRLDVDPEGGRIRRAVFEGLIAGAGFDGGDQFVIGVWNRTPFGELADVMWAQPDGTRVLLASRKEGADFITRHYTFDDVRLEDFAVAKDEKSLSVRAGELHLQLLLGGRRLASFMLRLRPGTLRRVPPWITFEDRLLRPLAVPLLFGGGANVKLRGRTRAGLRQWYGIHDYRPVVGGRAYVGARDLGSPVRLSNRSRFGFSEFPSQPGVVWVSSVFE